MVIPSDLRIVTGRGICVALSLVVLCLGLGMPARAQAATDFAGTVLSVDAAAGKLSVKKADGGTRFTFVVDDKTRFEGAGLTSLKDVKKGENVTVNYVVSGSQYVAVKVTAKSK